MSTSPKEHVLSGEVMRELGTGRRGLRNLIEARLLSVVEVPGCRRRFLRSEVRALAERFTRRGNPTAALPARK